MLIRGFKADDEETFLRLCNEFYSQNATVRPFDATNAKKTFIKIVNGHNNLWGYFLIDKINNYIFGYILITSYWCNEEGGKVIVLDEIYVEREYQHKGYAKQCINWIQNRAKNDAVEITLEVKATNFIAKELYKKEGFEYDGFESYTKRLK